LGAEREEETYLFLTITPSITPYRLEDADFDGATITFRVPGQVSPRRWILRRPTPHSDTVVNGQWMRLKTTHVKEEEGRGMLRSGDAPGFSISVIVFKKSGAMVLKDLLGREVDVVTEKGGCTGTSGIASAGGPCRCERRPALSSRVLPTPSFPDQPLLSSTKP